MERILIPIDVELLRQIYVMLIEECPYRDDTRSAKEWYQYRKDVSGHLENLVKVNDKENENKKRTVI